MDDQTHSGRAQSGPSRRGVMAVGGVVVLAAAGGGVALGRSRKTADPAPFKATVPAELAAAVAAERALLATVDAAISTVGGHRRAELRLIRADHVAHLAAVQAAIVQAVYPAVVASLATSPSESSVTTSAAPPPTTPVSSATVRRREQRASRAAAARAQRLSGAQAVLLASIAASEATHAEVLR